MRYTVRIKMDVELGRDFQLDAAKAEAELRGLPLRDYLVAAYTGVNVGGQMAFEPNEVVAVIVEEK